MQICLLGGPGARGALPFTGLGDRRSSREGAQLFSFYLPTLGLPLENCAAAVHSLNGCVICHYGGRLWGDMCRGCYVEKRGLVLRAVRLSFVRVLTSACG